MTEEISNFLGISSELFQLPSLLTDFLFPLILFSIALYFIIEKIFSSKIVNAIISFGISFITVVLFNPGGIIAPLSIFFICLTKISGAKGAIIGIIAAIIYAFLIGWVAELLSPTYY
ncbi:MAG: hypothetical protein QXP77_00020 [Candidatus Aenigmatarchaeota archaeon]